MFPFNLEKFEKDHKLLALLSRSFINKPILEICFYKKVHEILKKNFANNKNRICWLPYRKYVYWLNHRHVPQLGYLSQHKLDLKREIMIQANLEKYCPSLETFGWPSHPHCG